MARHRSHPPGSRRAAPVGASRTGIHPSEARWFVPGPLPSRLAPSSRPVRRRDEYDLVRMTPGVSTKRRGGERLEWKVRVGRVELVEIAGVVGFAEQWSKSRTGPGGRRRGDWVVVGKEVWRRPGLQICSLELAGEAWWSVAVACAHQRADELLDAWAPLLERDGLPGSYPSWLLATAGGRAPVVA